MERVSKPRFILAVVLYSLFVLSFLAPSGSIWEFAGFACLMIGLLVGTARSELNREMRFTVRGFFLPLIAVALLTMSLQLLFPREDYFRKPGVVAALWLAMVIVAFWRRRSPAKANSSAPEAQR